MPRKEQNKIKHESGGKPISTNVGRNLPFNNNNKPPKKAKPSGSLSHTMHAFKEGAPVILGKPPLFPQSKTVFPQGTVQRFVTAASTAAVAADEARRNMTAYGAGGNKSKSKKCK